jgi:hypothetical protein
VQQEVLQVVQQEVVEEELLLHSVVYQLEVNHLPLAFQACCSALTQTALQKAV